MIAPVIRQRRVADRRAVYFDVSGVGHVTKTHSVSMIQMRPTGARVNLCRTAEGWYIHSVEVQGPQVLKSGEDGKQVFTNVYVTGGDDLGLGVNIRWAPHWVLAEAERCKREADEGR